MKNCLGIWYRSAFRCEGNTFFCVGQYLAYAKAVFFRDNNTANKILEAKGKKDVTELEAMIKGFDDDVWDSFSRDIAVRGHYLKFMQNCKMKEFLLAQSNLDDILTHVREDILNTNIIYLNVRKDAERLAGHTLGDILYKEQIRGKLDFTKINIIVFPDYVIDVAIGFVKGLLCDIPLAEFNSRVLIKANSRVEAKVQEYFYF